MSAEIIFLDEPTVLASVSVDTYEAHLPSLGMSGGKVVAVKRSPAGAAGKIVARYVCRGLEYSRTWALVVDNGSFAFYQSESDTAYSFPRRAVPFVALATR